MHATIGVHMHAAIGVQMHIAIGGTDACYDRGYRFMLR